MPTLHVNIVIQAIVCMFLIFHSELSQKEPDITANNDKSDITANKIKRNVELIEGFMPIVRENTMLGKILRILLIFRAAYNYT